VEGLTDRQTDRHDEAHSLILKFCDALKTGSNWCQSEEIYQNINGLTCRANVHVYIISTKLHWHTLKLAMDANSAVLLRDKCRSQTL
jgi:hypothetical protein